MQWQRKSKWVYGLIVLLSLLVLAACTAAPLKAQKVAPTPPGQQRTLELIDFYSPM